MFTSFNYNYTVNITIITVNLHAKVTYYDKLGAIKF